MPTPSRPLEERFREKVRRDASGCLIWTASINSKGYGRIRNEHGRSELAHRVAWRLAGRSLTKGLELDHLCRTILCCEISHLEEVPHHINVARGSSPAALARQKGECMRGHAMSTEHGRRQNSGKWQCRTCINETRRRKRTLSITPGWILAEVITWAADEIEAQAAQRGEAERVNDYIDHLRLFATQTDRVSAIPWPSGLAQPRSTS